MFRHEPAPRPACRSAVLAAALLCAAAVAAASPAAPPTSVLAALPRPENVASDPPDVSEYLAAWQAAAYARSLEHFRPMTLNQQSYDVKTYDLNLFPNVDTGELTATVRMRARVVGFSPLTTLDLDFDDLSMGVDNVTSAGVQATYTHLDGIITVDLDRAYTMNEMVDIVVDYHGIPSDGALGAAYTTTIFNGQPFVATLSEPYDARQWWPCKDDPSDKADTVDIRVTVPYGMITASNGVLLEDVDLGEVVYRHWRETHPISTYLVSIASYAYTVTYDNYHAVPIVFHIFPGSVQSTAAVNAKVKTMMGAYEPRFGPYPFGDEKYGHAQFLWGGGMEHQTCTSLGSFGEYTVAHELGHQWFGDKVTCRDFHHIWLNEGFATFCEAIWAEATGGMLAYHNYKNARAYFGSGSVYVPDASDANRVFNSNLSYKKGSWVLHMLRHVMGDSLFFVALKSYLQQYAYSTAVTEDFQAVCEATCGRDLDKFFQQWVYGQYYPQYRFVGSWVAAPGGGYDVTAAIQQTQSWQIFWAPIDVRVNTASGSFTFTANDSTPFQLFTYHVPYQPTSVQLDPDQWVLRQITSVADAATIPDGARLELSASPNPAPGRTTVEFRTPHVGEATIEVMDAAGRRVARLQRGVVQAGTHRVSWAGRSDAGRDVGPGVYWISLEFEGKRLTRRLALVN